MIENFLIPLVTEQKWLRLIFFPLLPSLTFHLKMSTEFQSEVWIHLVKLTFSIVLKRELTFAEV